MGFVNGVATPVLRVLLAGDRIADRGGLYVADAFSGGVVVIDAVVLVVRAS